MTNAVYKDILLDHYRHPRNQGSLDGAHMIGDGFNAKCGDKLQIGIFINGDTVTDIKYKIRACAICTASTSMMTQCLCGCSTTEIQHLIAQVQSAVQQSSPWPVGCEALSGAATSINRHQCILLGWQAVAETLAKHQA